MDLRSSIRVFFAGMAMLAGMAAVAQTQTPSTTPAPAPTPAAAPAADAAAAPAPKPWRIGPFDATGFADGYYSFNDNHPTGAANGESNDLYNFNFNANQPSLSGAKLTLNHHPGKLASHFAFIYADTTKPTNPK